MLVCVVPNWRMQINNKPRGRCISRTGGVRPPRTAKLRRNSLPRDTRDIFYTAAHSSHLRFIHKSQKTKLITHTCLIPNSNDPDLPSLSVLQKNSCYTHPAWTTRKPRIDLFIVRDFIIQDVMTIDNWYREEEKSQQIEKQKTGDQLINLVPLAHKSLCTRILILLGWRYHAQRRLVIRTFSFVLL